MKKYVPHIIYNILEALKSTYRNLLGDGYIDTPLHLCFPVIKRVIKKNLMDDSMGHDQREIIAMTILKSSGKLSHFEKPPWKIIWKISILST